MSRTLDRSSPRALHEQLSEHIRGLIGDLGGEGRLPSEDELGRRFDVSRATVRRAVETLVSEGALVRRQGRGTFVARPHVVGHLDRLGPFVEAFTGDEDVEARLLSFAWVSAAQLDSRSDALAPDGDVLAFERLYLTDGVAHALVRVIVPAEIGRRITRAQIEHHPIYHVLRDQLHLTLREAHIALRCEPASPGVAGALGLEDHSSVLVLERSTTGGDGGVVEVATHYLRPDVYQLELTARGGSLPRLIRLPSPASERLHP